MSGLRLGRGNALKEATKKEPKARKRFCMNEECKAQAVSHGYCRLHYIANYRTIKLSEQIKAERRLNAYVDRLSRRFPGEVLEKIKEGIESDEKFKAAVEELDLDTDPEPTETEREFLERYNRKKE